MPPLVAKPRVRGRKPHDPKFDVRTALYYVTGVDLTAIEGIDEMHALTLVSELGCDFSKWPTVKFVRCQSACRLRKASIVPSSSARALPSSARYSPPS